MRSTYTNKEPGADFTTLKTQTPEQVRLDKLEEALQALTARVAAMEPPPPLPEFLKP